MKNIVDQKDVRSIGVWGQKGLHKERGGKGLYGGCESK
jgi:hypothetical protein